MENSAIQKEKFTRVERDRERRKKEKEKDQKGGKEEEKEKGREEEEDKEEEKGGGGRARFVYLFTSPTEPHLSLFIVGWLNWWSTCWEYKHRIHNIEGI